MDITREHTKGGRGRFWFGVGMAGLGLFWLAKKAGWLGVGAGGWIWPALALGLGIAVAAGGCRRGHRLRPGRGVEPS